MRPVTVRQEENMAIQLRVSRESRASLVAQLVKNPPAMQIPASGSWIRFLGQEDPMKKG